MKRLSDLLHAAWRSVSAIIAIVLIVVAFGFGLSLGGGGGGAPTAPSVGASSRPQSRPQSPSGSEAPTEYTCSMHPQVRLPDPDAKCPICSMSLIPVTPAGAGEGEGEGEDRDRVLVMTPAAAALADIRTTPVVRRYPEQTVRLFGSIDYDETRTATIAAYVPGRLERLFVDYTGIPVQAGDHLVEIYSPDLVTAEAELVALSGNLARMRGTVGDGTVRSVESTVEGAREKLRLWGLTPEQIRTVEETGETSDRLTVYSPMGGVVIRKHKVTGDYVKTGEPIFTVADFTHLWLRLDAYTSDLRWLRYGQPVEFTTESYPGETFHGRVSFIDPEVSRVTRTAKIRVNVDNTDRRLKPGMFVRAVVKPVIGSGGEVIAEDMAGRWVCPMHPEIVKDREDKCDLCGMDLVPAEGLGYVAQETTGRPPLVIPASAPLITGTRAVVYVRLRDRVQPTFEGREVVLGPRAGDVYMVHEDAPTGANLSEGDEVVVNGAFKIDSALQIAAKPSMMDPVAAPAVAVGDHRGVTDPSRRVEAPAAFVAGLAPVYRAYFEAQEALAADDLQRFRRGVSVLETAVGVVETEGLGPARPAWRRAADRLGVDAGPAADLEAARRRLDALSRAIIDLERAFGHSGDGAHYVTFCPMAFDNRGAHWLARSPEIHNPYFGAAMPRCGIVQETSPAGAPSDVKGGAP